MPGVFRATVKRLREIAKRMDRTLVEGPEPWDLESALELARLVHEHPKAGTGDHIALRELERILRVDESLARLREITAALYRHEVPGPITDDLRRATAEVESRSRVAARIALEVVELLGPEADGAGRFVPDLAKVGRQLRWVLV